MPETTTPVDDPFARAAAAVSEPHFRGADGRAVRQTTDTAVILRHLRLADVRPGQRVLEIGTGSGLSTALLAELVGPHGQVVSLDVMQELTERAAHLHTAAGYTNATFLARDGREGAPEHGPYDRIVAWACPAQLPDTWLTQAAPGAVVLHPLPVARLAYATVMLRCTVDATSHPSEATVHRGAYARMADAQHQARESDDADATSEQGYVCAEWLRATRPGRAAAVLQHLEAATHSEQVELSWPECDDLRAWLIAQHPDGLISAGRGGEVGYGIAEDDHVALLVLLPHPRLLADAADSPALRRLRELLHTWIAAGRPGTETNPPTLHRLKGGWQARL